MKRKPFNITLNHIILITSLLVLIKIVILSYYTHYFFQRADNQRNQWLTQNVLHIRHELTGSPKKLKSIPFIKGMATTHTSALPMATAVTLLKSTKMPQNAIILKSNTNAISHSNYKRMLSMLKKHHLLTISSYFKPMQAWITFQVKSPPNDKWTMLIMMILSDILIIALAWIMFFLYYKHSVPKNVMRSIEGNKYKSDQMVSYLTQKIREHFHEKNLMLTALSHDIKTPLTEAMLTCEMMEGQPTAQRLRGQLEAINSIIKSSLEFSKPPEKINQVKVEIISLIDSIVERYKMHGFHIDFEHQMQSCEMEIEIALFNRMMNNLIDNAKKYGKSCSISIAPKNNNQIEIQILDNGPGVPEETLASLAKPYFRVDQSRSRNTGGTGLGLAIVKKIVQLHQGKTHFSNRPQGGFQVTLTFPQQALDLS